MWQEFPGIFAIVEPANLKLYRELLPEAMEMPEKPQVAVFIADYQVVVPWPMGPYLEGAVAIRCSYENEDGWHVLTMPVTTKVANMGGRMMGFPKYVADEIQLKQDGVGWKGVVNHQGIERLYLEFMPVDPEELTTAQKEQAQSKAAKMEEPIFQLDPPDEGPRINRIYMKQIIPAHWESTPGTVKIRIAEQDSWAGLIPAETTFPALFQRFSGGNNLVYDKVN
jgi:acetoacetate decarboxylase